MKNIRFFYLKIFKCLDRKFSIYLNRHVFIMDKKDLMVQIKLGNRYTFRGEGSLYKNCFISLLKKWSILKGKSKFCPLRGDSLSEETWCAGTIVVSLVKMKFFKSKTYFNE